MATKVVIDAGHGGEDFGATYNGRQEKTDNLNLAFAVGSVLSNNGIDVEYTRVEDVYDTPFQKAQKANAADADFFISFHRNATENPTRSIISKSFLILVIKNLLLEYYIKDKPCLY